MKTIDQWLNEYGRDHKNPLNQKIHKVCVPLIMFSILGIFWSIPVPKFMDGIYFLNWATIFAAFSLAYYLILDRVYFIIMIFVASIMLLLIDFLEQSSNLLTISLTIFILSWIGQFIGHKIEGQKPSFLEDLQFLLIGPLWVFKGFRGKITLPF